MGRPLIDITGQKFGKLTVRCKSDRIAKNGSPYWICDCECGNVTEVEKSNLKRGNIISCGKCRVYNIYEEKDGYMIGYQRNGKHFLFDKEDFEKVKKYNWSVNGSGYVLNTSAEINGKIGISMHRYLMDPPEDMFIDHINHITYDNRKENLRVCTASQNEINKRRKGYTIRKNGKYEVSLRISGKYIYVGRFNTEEEAIVARRAAYDEDHKKFEYKEL